MSTLRELSDLDKAVLSEANRFPVTITNDGLIRFPYPDLPPIIRSARALNVGGALTFLHGAGYLHHTITAEGDHLFFGPDPQLVKLFGKRKD